MLNKTKPCVLNWNYVAISLLMHSVWRHIINST
jgi:hypothetical protein